MNQIKTPSDPFDRAKGFSDFLGFHVRFAFCVAVALVALGVPATSFISEGEKTGIWALEDAIGILLFFVVIGCAARIGWLTLRTGLDYLHNDATSFLATATRRFFKVCYVVIQVTVLLWILVYGGYQALNLTGVDTDEFICQVNSRLSETNYPLTPPKPSYCDPN